ncbi:MAG: ribulose-phosphate 3-epimerase [Phycisphaerales bacterium]
MMRREAWLSPRRTPLVAPSILSADFSRLGEECRAALDGGGDLLHVDVMDGHFVPNLTMGPALCRSLRVALPDVFLDVHMMVDDPAKFIDSFADAGADLFTFHLEAVPQPRELAAAVRAAGMLVGLACNPDMPAARVVPFVDAFDEILVMSVFPGFSGQRFMPEVLDKVRAIKPLLGPRQRLEMDGGVSPDTAPACRAAGCDVLVAASAVFGHAPYGDAIAALRGDDPRPGDRGGENARRAAARGARES